MRNVSLEQFYKKINKQIAIAGAYTENIYLPQIIKGCRLKPITIFSKYFTPTSILERCWIDEFNNILEIKKKIPQVKFNAGMTSQITTDIYRNETANFISERSKLACVGLYKNTADFILLLWGTDNYWRAYTYHDNQLSICSPLTGGIKVLQSCLRWQTKSFKKMKSELKTLHDVDWVMIKLPIHQIALHNIDSYDKLRSILM